MKDNTSKLLGLEEAIVRNVEETDGGLLVDVELPRRAHRCPDCGRWTDRIHDYRLQRVKDSNAFGKPVILRLRKRRYVCTDCGKRFYEQNSGLNPLFPAIFAGGAAEGSSMPAPRRYITGLTRFSTPSTFPTPTVSPRAATTRPRSSSASAAASAILSTSATGSSSAPPAHNKRALTRVHALSVVSLCGATPTIDIEH